MSVRTLLELSVACIAVSMAACGSSAQRAFTPDDEAAIHAANQAYAKAEVAGDFDKWFAFSTPDAVYMPEQSKILRGREAISGWFKQLSPGGATLETTSEEITGHEDMALVSGSYVVSAPGGPGGQTLRVTGNYMSVWQRQPDGKWRITKTIWNSDQPAN